MHLAVAILKGGGPLARPADGQEEAALAVQQPEIGEGVVAGTAAHRRGAEGASRPEGVTNAAEVVLFSVLGGVSEAVPQEGRAVAQAGQNQSMMPEGGTP